MLKRFLAVGAVVVMIFCCGVLAYANPNLPEGVGQCVIDDSAQLLNAQDEAELMEYGRRIADETGLVIFVKTTDMIPDYREVRVYLADEYEAHGFTDAMPSIMLGIDMGSRELAVVTSEISDDVYPVGVTNRMVKNVTSYLSDGEYRQAVERFLSDAESYAMNYGIKPVGRIVGISFAAGAVIAVVTVGTMLYSHPKIKNSRISASKYLKGNRAQIYNQRDRFVSSRTTKRKIESDSGSGGISGGSFTSSSGGSFSGSSGKF